MMAAKYMILFVALLAGSFAIPAPKHEDDMSIFFQDPEPSERIVGGTDAAPGSHPHMVALTNGLISSSLFCGGSLISKRSVLTAAHCINFVYSRGSLDSSLRVTVGTDRWNRGGVSYRVARNVSHPHYLSAAIKNDIGLLITTTIVAVSTRVSPIPLELNEIPGGVEVRVAGWGRMRVNGGGSLSNNLQELITTTVDGQVCVQEAARASVELNIRDPAVEPHIEICTYHSPGHGTCRGDSGSALARVSDGALIGVISWGFPCARGAPDMFARASGFKDWLLENIVWQ